MNRPTPLMSHTACLRVLSCPSSGLTSVRLQRRLTQWLETGLIWTLGLLRLRLTQLAVGFTDGGWADRMRTAFAAHEADDGRL